MTLSMPTAENTLKTPTYAILSAKAIYRPLTS